jgi:hypothetical protein
MAMVTDVQPGSGAAGFARDGYCVQHSVLSQDEIVAARTALQELIAATPDRRPEWLSEPHLRSHSWLELCRHPRVVEAVREVLGDDLIMIMSHLIVKPAGDGLKIGWHQDSPTWPQITGTDMVTAWLAIDRSDVGNGCMRVIPRSHADRQALNMLKDEPGNVFDFRVEVSAEQEAAQVAVELEAGDISLHDSFVIHGSEANRSDRRRAGYTMRYANSRTVRVDVAKHWSPVYIVSGSVEGLARGYIDLRPGAPLPPPQPSSQPLTAVTP